MIEAVVLESYVHRIQFSKPPYQGDAWPEHTSSVTVWLTKLTGCDNHRSCEQVDAFRFIMHPVSALSPCNIDRQILVVMVTVNY